MFPSATTSSPLKLFFQILSHFAYKDKFSMKGPFSKPLLFENGIFSAKTNYLGSVRVAKDPSTLGGSCVVPFPKNKHVTLLHFWNLPMCSLAIENSWLIRGSAQLSCLKKNSVIFLGPGIWGWTINQSSYFLSSFSLITSFPYLALPDKIQNTSEIQVSEKQWILFSV